MDTMEVGDTRTAKIQAYVDERSKAYLVKLATQNARKISAQLNLILQEHEATNGVVGAVRETGSHPECDYAQS